MYLQLYRSLNYGLVYLVRILWDANVLICNTRDLVVFGWFAWSVCVHVCVCMYGWVGEYMGEQVCVCVVCMDHGALYVKLYM